MKAKNPKEKTPIRKTIQNTQPFSSSSDEETFEDFEENLPLEDEEEKISINGESQLSIKEGNKASKKQKLKPPVKKNSMKKLKNQKKPKIVMNVSGLISSSF